MGWWISTGETEDSMTGTYYKNGPVQEPVRKFKVLVSDPTVGVMTVCRAPFIPSPLSFYDPGNPMETNAFCILVDISASLLNSDDRTVWIVTCKYSTRPSKSQNDQSQNNNHPENEPPDIEWDFEVTPQSPPHDLDGKPYFNSAFQPFSPAYSTEVAYPVLMISRNELGFDYEKAQGYAFSVNDAPFLGADEGRVQCYPPKAKMMFRGPMTYWRVSYKLRFFYPLGDGLDEEDVTLDWQPKILDAGLCELQKNPLRGLFNQPIPILRNQVPVSQPVCLDGTGSPSLPDPITKEIKPTYLHFRQFKKKSFTDLLKQGLGP